MLNADEIRKALLAKGMVQDSNDHEYFRKHLDGVATLVTRLSWKGKGHDVSDALVGLMARQSCLRAKEFKALVSCELTQEEWDKLIGERCPGGHNPFLNR